METEGTEEEGREGVETEGTEEEGERGWGSGKGRYEKRVGERLTPKPKWLLVEKNVTIKRIRKKKIRRK